MMCTCITWCVVQQESNVLCTAAATESRFAKSNNTQASVRRLLLYHYSALPSLVELTHSTHFCTHVAPVGLFACYSYRAATAPWLPGHRQQEGPADPHMAADATSDKVWHELRKLRRDIPPPEENAEQGSSFYKDYAAFAACNEVRSTIGRCSELPRDQFLNFFTHLVAGSRLEELFDLFKASRNPEHPALQYACLLALHGVAELGDRRKDLLSRPDVVVELCAVMASPRQRVVTPTSAGAAGSEVINAAAGAVTTITGLFTSNGCGGVWSRGSFFLLTLIVFQ